MKKLIASLTAFSILVSSMAVGFLVSTADGEGSLPSGMTERWGYEQLELGELISAESNNYSADNWDGNQVVKAEVVTGGVNSGSKQLAVTLPGGASTATAVMFHYKNIAMEKDPRTKVYDWTGANVAYFYVDASEWAEESAGPRVGLQMNVPDNGVYATWIEPKSAWLQSGNDWIEAETAMMETGSGNQDMGGVQIPAGYKGFVAIELDSLWFSANYADFSGICSQADSFPITAKYHDLYQVKTVMESDAAENKILYLDALGSGSDWKTPGVEAPEGMTERWGYEQLELGELTSAESNNYSADNWDGNQVVKAEVVAGGVSSGNKQLAVTLPGSATTATSVMFHYKNIAQAVDPQTKVYDWTGAQVLYFYVDASEWAGESAGPRVGLQLNVPGGIYASWIEADSAYLQANGTWVKAQTAMMETGGGNQDMGGVQIPSGYKGFVAIELSSFWFSTDIANFSGIKSQAESTPIDTLYNDLYQVKTVMESDSPENKTLYLDALGTGTDWSSPTVIVPGGMTERWGYEQLELGELTSAEANNYSADNWDGNHVLKSEVISGNVNGGSKQLAVTLPGSATTATSVMFHYKNIAQAADPQTKVYDWTGAQVLYFYVDASAWLGEGAGPRVGLQLHVPGGIYATWTEPESAYLQSGNGWIEAETAMMETGSGNQDMGGVQIPAGYVGFVAIKLDSFWFSTNIADFSGIKSQEESTSITELYNDLYQVKTVMESDSPENKTLYLDALGTATEWNTSSVTVPEGMTERWGYEQLELGELSSSEGNNYIVDNWDGNQVLKSEVVAGNVNGGSKQLAVTLPGNATTATAMMFHYKNIALAKDPQTKVYDWTGSKMLYFYVDASDWAGEDAGPRVGLQLVVPGGIYATWTEPESAYLQSGNGWIEAETAMMETGSGNQDMGGVQIPADYVGFVAVKLSSFWFSTNIADFSGIKSQEESTLIDTLYNDLYQVKTVMESDAAEEKILYLDALGSGESTDDFDGEDGSVKVDGERDAVYNAYDSLLMQESGNWLGLDLPATTQSVKLTFHYKDGDANSIYDWTGADSLYVYVDASAWEGSASGPKVGLILTAPVPKYYATSTKAGQVSYYEGGSWKELPTSLIEDIPNEGKVAGMELPAGYRGYLKIDLDKLWYKQDQDLGSVVLDQTAETSIKNFYNDLYQMQFVITDPTAGGHTLYFDSFSVDSPETKDMAPFDPDSLKVVWGCEGMPIGTIANNTNGFAATSWNGVFCDRIYVGHGGTRITPNPYEVGDNPQNANTEVYYYWDDKYIYFHASVTQDGEASPEDALTILLDPDPSGNPSARFDENFAGDGQSEIGVTVTGDGSVSFYEDTPREARAVGFSEASQGTVSYGVEFRVPRIANETEFSFAVGVSHGDSVIISSNKTQDLMNWNKANSVILRRHLDGSLEHYSEDKVLVLDKVYSDNPYNAQAKVYYDFDDNYVYLYAIATQEKPGENENVDSICLWLKPDISNYGRLWPFTYQTFVQSPWYGDISPRVSGDGATGWYALASKQSLLAPGWITFSNTENGVTTYGMELCFERPEGEKGFSIAAQLRCASVGISGFCEQDRVPYYEDGITVYYDENTKTLADSLKEAVWDSKLTNKNNGLVTGGSVEWSGRYDEAPLQPDPDEPPETSKPEDNGGNTSTDPGGDNYDPFEPGDETASLAELVEEAIRTNTDRIYLSVWSDDCIFTPELLQKLQEAGLPVTLQVFDREQNLLIVWMFDAITWTEGDFNPLLKEECPYAETVLQLAQGLAKQHVCFAQEGEFPGAATILIPNQAGFAPGDAIELYRYKLAEEELEKMTGSISVSNDQTLVAIALDAGGEYVLVQPDKANEVQNPEPDPGENGWPGWLIGILIGAGVLVVAGTTTVVIFILKKKGGKKIETV